MQRLLHKLVIVTGFAAAKCISLRAASEPEVAGSETLWSGLDPPNVQPLDLLATGENLRTALQGRLPYILLGPEDSGTNLLEHIIESNWPGKFVSTNKANLLWKHSLWRNEIYDLLEREFKDLKRFPAFAAIRSPISQVASWRKAPYDMKQCVERNLNTMNTSCRVDLSARPIGYRGFLESVNFRQTNFKQFKSTMDVYNEYVRQYKHMGTEGRFKSFKMVLYEDMVFSPDKVVQELAAALEVHVPQAVQLVDAPAKTAGKPVGREEALEKLLSRTYMEDMGQIGLKTLCPDLDVSLMEGLVEGSYLPLDEQTPYTADCDELWKAASADDAGKHV
mmetsp:Transcript_55001/g.128633  ORF Transcript_55001/g.128633 Transcript_55001/m.128633 type:complete len:335 (+) Transcript_55001:93-1097(+)